MGSRVPPQPRRGPQGLRHPSRRAPAAFTLVELLVVLAIASLLLALTMVGLSRSRQTARSLTCLNHLRQIGLSFTLYAGENKTRLPDPLPLETTWESLVLRYLNHRGVFECPSDNEAFPALGSSYDWRDSGDPVASVAGRSISQCRPDAVVAFEALPGWHFRRKVNVVRLDGSAEQMAEQAAFAELRRPAAKSGSSQSGPK